MLKQIRGRRGRERSGFDQRARAVDHNSVGPLRPRARRTRRRPRAPPAPAANPAGKANFVTKQTSDQHLTSKFKGTDVIGADDAKIGDVSDLLFDKDHKIITFIVGVGGFLGIGTKDVAIDPASFQAVPGKDATDMKLRLSMTKDELKNAAAFEPYQPPRPVSSQNARPARWARLLRRLRPRSSNNATLFGETIGQGPDPVIGSGPLFLSSPLGRVAQDREASRARDGAPGLNVTAPASTWESTNGCISPSDVDVPRGSGARRREGVNMARLTARISRLEARDGAREYGGLAHLSGAELDARLCRVAEKLTADMRDMLRDGMSVADILVEMGRWPDDPFIAALLAEAQTPAFDAARFRAAALGPVAGNDVSQ